MNKIKIKFINLPKNILRKIIFKPINLDKNKKLTVSLYQKDFPLFSNIFNADLHIYNGNKFKTVKINSQMFNYSAGEFIFTRKMMKNIHQKKNKKK